MNKAKLAAIVDKAPRTENIALPRNGLQYNTDRVFLHNNQLTIVELCVNEHGSAFDIGPAYIYDCTPEEIESLELNQYDYPAWWDLSTMEIFSVPKYYCKNCASHFEQLNFDERNNAICPVRACGAFYP